jgi:hypothetical protein
MMCSVGGNKGYYNATAIEGTYLASNNAACTEGGENGSSNGSMMAPKTLPIVLSVMQTFCT